MGYTVNELKNARWGLPASLLALILGVVISWGLSGPAPAYGATISCGQCHSNPPADSDNSGCKQVSKSHPRHTWGDSATAPTTCSRCHPVPPDSQPTSQHNNNIINISSVSSIKLGYNSGTQNCTKACHKNRDDAYWNNTQLSCNSCHFRTLPLGNVSTSGLHVMADHSYKHYSSTIKVTNNASTITCSNCHPVPLSNATSFMTHIRESVSTQFVQRADVWNASFTNVTLLTATIGYAKGASRGVGGCTKSCHYNSGDPFLNNTVYYSPTNKVRLGSYQSSAWNASDLKCDECHSTPGQAGTFANKTTGTYGNPAQFVAYTGASNNANKRHKKHMFNYKLDSTAFPSDDRNIYCVDCHKVPNTAATRSFRGHTTLGQGGSGIISLPVASQNAKIYLNRRNNGLGRDNSTAPAFNTTKASCTNVYCHTVLNTALWTADSCNSCHGTKDGVKVTSGAPGLANVTSWYGGASYGVKKNGFEEYSGGAGSHYYHVKQRGIACRVCHINGGPDGNPANHHSVSNTVARANVNVKVMPSWRLDNNTTTDYDFSTRTCSSVKCHYGASMAWDCEQQLH